MIKITPYNDNPRNEEILKLYLYLVAKSVPFYPEDVFSDGYFYPDGKTKKPVSEFKKQPRARWNKGKKTQYSGILKKYHIVEKKDADRETMLKNDALLAEAIIKANSEKLHKHLYDGMPDGHVDHDNLYALLTASVSHNELEERVADSSSFYQEAISAEKGKREDLLNHVFRYEVFSRQAEIYQLLMLFGVEICPYCNRQFITTVAEGKKKSRPQIDHFHDKSKHPFLALSIMNLVPCCGFCNLKKSDDEKKILYPYYEEMGDAFSFRVDAERDLTVLTGTRISKEELSLSFVHKETGSPLNDHINASIDLFNLKNTYRSHLGYISDLLFQRYIFTDDMVNEICSKHLDLFKDQKEVRELLLLGKLGQENWGDRPLGKLTHDITIELDELDDRYKRVFAEFENYKKRTQKECRN